MSHLKSFLFFAILLLSSGDVFASESSELDDDGPPDYVHFFSQQTLDQLKRELEDLSRLSSDSDDSDSETDSQTTESWYPEDEPMDELTQFFSPFAQGIAEDLTVFLMGLTSPLRSASWYGFQERYIRTQEARSFQYYCVQNHSRLSSNPFDTGIYFLAAMVKDLYFYYGWERLSQSTLALLHEETELTVSKLTKAEILICKPLDFFFYAGIDAARSSQWNTYWEGKAEAEAYAAHAYDVFSYIALHKNILFFQNLEAHIPRDTREQALALAIANTIPLPHKPAEGS